MVGVEFLYAHPKLLLHCCIKKYDGQRGQERTNFNGWKTTIIIQKVLLKIGS